MGQTQRERLTKRINYLKVMKVAIGSTIAILFANWIGLQYSASAGIITLLSITNTKKDTISLAKNRLVAFCLSTIIAYCLFELMGYNTYVFGVYILIFMSSCCVLGLSNAVSICAVLTTHILARGNMEIEGFVNESLLFLIGAGVGVLLNLYMPNNDRILHNGINKIDDRIRTLFGIYARKLNVDSVKMSKEEIDEALQHVMQLLEETILCAYAASDNRLRGNQRYYIEYLEMRRYQLRKLHQLNQLIHRLTYLPTQAELISELCEEMQKVLHENNNGIEPLMCVQEIRLELQRQEIPVTRIEFENRAILFQMLQEIEEFIRMKLEFVNQLSQEQLGSYQDRMK